MGNLKPFDRFLAMVMVKRFLDGIGNFVLWIDFGVQGIGVILRFLLFSLISLVFPVSGVSNHEWNLRPPHLPSWIFGSLWVGSIVVLILSTSVYVLLGLLIAELGWSLYALLNSGGERRREIFFHMLAVQGLSVVLLIVFVIGSGITSWLRLDEFHHHGNLEAWVLLGFLVLRTGLFPFHAGRLDYLAEMKWLALFQTLFNSWVVFQAGLFMKCIGFMDAFGDWSNVIMAWVVISFLFGIGLSAVQLRANRLWANLYWILGHVALYVTTL